MMNRPAASEILKPGESYYSLVVAVAKLARHIVDEANEKEEIITEKPVTLAIDGFAKSKYKLIESEVSENGVE